MTWGGLTVRTLTSLREKDRTEVRLESPPARINCSLFLDTSLGLFLVLGTDSKFLLLVFSRS